MNFMQAISLLKQGKKIKRESDSHFWVVSKDNILQPIDNTYPLHPKYIQLDLDDYDAQDWMEVKG